AAAGLVEALEGRDGRAERVASFAEGVEQRGDALEEAGAELVGAAVDDTCTGEEGGPTVLGSEPSEEAGEDRGGRVGEGGPCLVGGAGEATEPGGAVGGVDPLLLEELADPGGQGRVAGALERLALDREGSIGESVEGDEVEPAL